MSIKIFVIIPDKPVCSELRGEPTRKPSYKKNGKKADNVRFGQTPPKRVKSGHLLSEKARKSRQMRFRDKTAYVWGLGYH